MNYFDPPDKTQSVSKLLHREKTEFTMSDKRHDPPKENQVPAPIGTSFLVKIKMHTPDAYMVLDSPQLVRDAIGDALER